MTTLASDQTELFIALVAAVGIDVAMLVSELETELREYDYSTQTSRLSDFLADVQEGEVDFRGLPFDEAVWEAMSAGDRLREAWDREDALALWAISDMVANRSALSQPLEEGDDTPANLSRHAFILRSLKTPQELDTLRSVYGDRLVVIAAYSPDEARADHLHEEIRESRRENDPAKWVRAPEVLIDRDASENRVGGQNVSDTFHRADFFIRGSDREVARTDIRRTLEIAFGHPYRTPTRDEYCQFMAAGAAHRSAELGRQVGAAIATKSGSILALGCNEVPKYKGGSHWEEEGQGNREFEVSEVETNRGHQQQIAEGLSEALSTYLTRVMNDASVEGSAAEEVKARLHADLPSELLSAGLKDITEYGRAVHAEMDALLDAARRGVAVSGCTVYTTTFPCHNCARHLVGAGVRRVVFVEPYPKSKAGDLHQDAISIGEGDPDEVLVFEPFVGVAPRRYLTSFDSVAREKLADQPRKTPDGGIRQFDKKQAVPLFRDMERKAFRLALPAYRRKELIALRHFEQLQGGAEPAPQLEISPDAESSDDQ